MSNKAEENSLRYRRAQSVTTAEEITEKEKKARRSQLDKPIHKPRDSLFSWSSEFTDFTGLVNWGFLMLTVGGLRLCLENFIKYGIRVNPFEWIIVLTGYNQGNRHHVVPAVLALLIEKAIAVDIISPKFGIGLQVSNIVFEICLPVIVLYFKGPEFSFVGISTVCMIYLVLFLKLWSYVQTNHWCRQGQKGKQYKNTLRRQSLSAPNWNDLVNAEQEQSMEDEKVDGKSCGLVKYPENLNLKDLLYFLLAPTLCYELNFPRTTRIRKRFLIKRLIEVVFGVNLVLALFQQWMIPSVTNAVDPFSEMSFIKITERLLKLAVPNHLIWLCFFYLSFHSFLNLMGELLHFADRSFYNDWWNARNIAEFWSSWNMPVHVWAVRHVYIPITALGFSKAAASIVVFFISAFFHEYLVNVLAMLCFCYLSFHSFLNLMGELLHFADRSFYNDWWNARNIAEFWSSWNMPVHVWAVRHVYIPITALGFSKAAASIVVFFISAFFHEYLVSVPLQMFRIWAFLGMMAQPPLSVISKLVQAKLGDRWGNIIVWSSLILGQPLAIMMYYHDYALLHFTPKP